MNKDTAYVMGAIADIFEQKLLNSKFRDRIGKEFDSEDIEFIKFINKAWRDSVEEYYELR